MDFRVMFHIGTRKPEPKRFRAGETGESYPRPHLLCEGVFLTPEWRAVAQYHLSGERKKRVYLFKVPMSVVKAAGSTVRYDRATEIFIPRELWGEIQFLGSKELPRKLITRDQRYGEQLRREEKAASEYRFEAIGMLMAEYGLSKREAYNTVVGRRPGGTEIRNRLNEIAKAHGVF